MNQRETVALISLLAITALVVLVMVTVRRRIAKQSGLATLPADNVVFGTLLGTATGHFVSTVFANNPLERVLSHGLMHRGLAEIRVFTDGIQINRVGERCYTIPVHAFVRVSRSTTTIDRAVENDGLLSIEWMLGSAHVVSNFRLSTESDTQSFFSQLLHYKSEGAVS
jgi:hypothetical protein